MLIREGVPAKLAKIWANEPVSAEYARPDNEKQAPESAATDEDSSEMAAYKEDVKRNPEKYLPEQYAEDLKSEGTEAWLKMLREELQEKEESGDTEGAKWTQGLIDKTIADQELNSKVREILVKHFKSGAMRPVVDSDWDKWRTAKGLPNITPPKKGAIFVEDIDEVKVPPLTGSDRVDFILSDKIDIYKHYRRFFGSSHEASHSHLYGWSENGGKPVMLDKWMVRNGRIRRLS